MPKDGTPEPNRLPPVGFEPNRDPVPAPEPKSEPDGGVGLVGALASGAPDPNRVGGKGAGFGAVDVKRPPEAGGGFEGPKVNRPAGGFADPEENRLPDAGGFAGLGGFDDIGPVEKSPPDDDGPVAKSPPEVDGAASKVGGRVAGLSYVNRDAGLGSFGLSKSEPFCSVCLPYSPNPSTPTLAFSSSTGTLGIVISGFPNLLLLSLPP